MRRAILFLAVIGALMGAMEANFGAIRVGAGGDITLPAGEGAIGFPAGALAQAVFDTGDPESATFGPTDILSDLNLPGGTGAIHYAYLGQDAIAGSHTWPEHFGNGPTLTGYQTTSFTYDNDAPFNDGTKAVGWTVDSSGIFSSTTAEDLGPGPYVVVLVLNMGYTGIGADHHFGLYDEGDDTGPELRARGTAGAICSMTYTSSLNQEILNAACNEDEWCVCVGVIGDGLIETRGGFAYGNGVEVDDDAQSSDRAGSGNVATLTIGGLPPTATDGDQGIGEIAALILIDGATGIDTEAKAHAYAFELSSRIMGSELATPSLTVPSVQTRASSSYLRVCDPDDGGGKTTYHQVGDNWPRREISCGYTWDDPTSSETQVSSFLVEPAATNVHLNSTDLSQANWIPNNATQATRDEPTPFAHLASGIIATTATSGHSLRDTVVLSSGVNVAFSAVVKAAAVNYAALYTDGVASAIRQHYDLTDCTVGTLELGSVVSADARDLGDGWCWLSFVALSNNITHTNYIYAIETEGVATWTGDNVSVGIHVALMQAEDGNYSTSPIETDGSTATRSADVLNYDWDTPLLTTAWTGIASVNYPDDGAATTQRNVWTLSNDGSASELIQIRPDTVTNGRTSMQVVDLAGGDSTNVSPFTAVELPDGAHHITRGYGEGAAEAFACVDGTCGSGITADSVSENLDRVHVGASRTNGGTAGGSIHRLRVFDQAIAPGEQGTGSDVP